MSNRYPPNRPVVSGVLITDPQIDFLKPESAVWDKVGETVAENAAGQEALDAVRTDCGFIAYETATTDVVVP